VGKVHLAVSNQKIYKKFILKLSKISDARMPMLGPIVTLFIISIPI